MFRPYGTESLVLLTFLPTFCPYGTRNNARTHVKYDLDYLRDFCDGDEEQMRHFIQKFEAQCPLEIGKLETAFQQQDRDAIYRAAHSFKPQLAFVGLHEAVALAASLEQSAKDGNDWEQLSHLLLAIKNAVPFQG
jgi:HPt (histidine-containing phosphotransfer) domain-containing protein